MRKFVIAIACALGISALTVAPASALNYNACNRGTIHVGHDLGVSNPGLDRLAYFCHTY